MAHSILIVEDEPNIVELLTFLMKRAGHQVRIARDGDAALRMMQAEIPALVLLDVMLPRRDGLEVCRAIRENAAWNAVRVVMLTAKGRELDRRKGMEMGADDYVIKPFATQDILDCIARQLQTSGDPDSRSGEWDAEGA
jgi:DNA-binding response OmpR family regulator